MMLPSTKPATTVRDAMRALARLDVLEHAGLGDVDLVAGW